MGDTNNNDTLTCAQAIEMVNGVKNEIYEKFKFDQAGQYLVLEKGILDSKNEPVFKDLCFLVDSREN